MHAVAAAPKTAKIRQQACSHVWMLMARERHTVFVLHRSDQTNSVSKTNNRRSCQRLLK